MSTNSKGNHFKKIFDSIDFSSILDHPNILIAAKFWEEERYCAAKTCYKFMRTIDDLIDNYKAANRSIKPSDRKEFVADVNEWLKMVIITDDCNPDKVELIKTIDRFSIPLWPVEDFARSMIYDINNDGFPTLNDFIEYSKGASVAPASIFVHLTGITKNGETYREPSFDVREAATPCAMFSYLVHIIRDFQKDQFNNLNYFADELVEKNGLSRKELRNIAHGSPVTEGFRNLIGEYFNLADDYRKKTFKILEEIKPKMEPRYQLSLEIIFSLYLMIFERIDPGKGNFTSFELNPTPEETRERVLETIEKFDI